MENLVVHKIALGRIADEINISIPYGAKILRISKQHPGDESVMIWYLCNPKNAKVARSVYVFGTGHPIPENLAEHWVGTEIFYDGGLVLHFFVKPEGAESDCPDCGRKKAKNAGDAARGFCPKWWAVRDQMAYNDCVRHSSVSTNGIGNADT